MNQVPGEVTHPADSVAARPAGAVLSKASGQVAADRSGALREVLSSAWDAALLRGCD